MQLHPRISCPFAYVAHTHLECARNRNRTLFPRPTFRTTLYTYTVLPWFRALGVVVSRFDVIASLVPFARAPSFSLRNNNLFLLNGSAILVV